MKTLTVSKVRQNIYNLIDDVSNEPIYVTGKHGNAVIISEEDWRAIQETLFLISIPGMKKSIVQGMKTPVQKLSRKLKW